MFVSWCMATAALTGLRPAEPMVVERFAAHVALSRTQHVPYRLYLPPTTQDQTFPLVVWFHGRGECGTNNVDQLAWLELLLTRSTATGLVPAPFPAAILAVQRRHDRPRHGRRNSVRLNVTKELQASQDISDWTPLVQTAEPQDGLARVDCAVADVCRRFPIDQGRIVGMGISEGAVACWDYAVRYPDRFDAIALMGLSRQVAAGLMPAPVWAFQSLADGTTRVSYCHALAREVRRRGGQMRVTIVNSGAHDCWTAAIREHQLVDWVLDAKRTSSWTLRSAMGVVAAFLVSVLMLMRYGNQLLNP